MTDPDFIPDVPADPDFRPLAYVTDSMGKVYEVDPSRLPDLTKQGYAVATPEQVSRFAREAKYGGAVQTAMSAAEGVADVLTLGTAGHMARGADAVERKVREALGFAAPETSYVERRAGRLESNPVAYGAGTAAGIIVPLILSGGTSGALQGTVKAAGAEAVAKKGVAHYASRTAPGQIASVGRVVGEGVEAGLTKLGVEGASTAAKVSRRAASLAAGSAVEGLAYGLGHEVSEAVLGDPIEAGEILASGVVGGVIGGGLGTVGAGSRALADKAVLSRRAGEFLTRLEQYQAERGFKVLGGIQKDLGKLSKKGVRLDGTGESSLREVVKTADEMGILSPFAGTEKILERAESHLARAGKEISQIIDDVTHTSKAEHYPSFRSVIDTAKQSVKESGLLKDPNQRAAAERYLRLLDDYEQTLVQEAADAALPAGKVPFRRLHEIRQQIDDALHGLKGNKDPWANAYTRQLDDLRQHVDVELDVSVKDALRRAGKQWSDLAPGAKPARDVTGIPEAWDKANKEYRVAKIARDLADSARNREVGNNMVSLTEQMAGMSGGVGGAVIGAVTGNVGSGLIGGGLMSLGTGAVQSSIRRYGSDALYAGARAAHRGVRRARDRAIASVELEHGTGGFGLPPELANVSRREALEAFTRTDEAARFVTREVAANARRVRAGEEPHPNAPKVDALAAVERRQQAVTKGLRDAAKNLVQGARPSLAGAARSAVAASSPKMLEVLERVNSVANNPAAMHEAVSQAIDDFADHAPDASLVAATAITRGAQYLAQTAPQRRVSPLGRVSEPSATELGSWERRFETVNDPVKVISGGRIGREEVETLRVVYPAMYDRLKREIISEVANNPNIPYQRALQLSRLMNVDLTGTLAQMQAHQAALQQGQAEQQQQAPKASIPGAGKLSVPSRLQTPTQKLMGG